ncbi:hypothetical protein EAW52_24220 [Pseudomonas sp. LTJR-52]|uniref:hypothetical protein n=1 Tax=Pseudomonas TaxID=286 RepID=UPI000EFB5879|nr:hypothetical protein [Pseudomonas sp. LTJR-52]AYN96818.1 hypothetical protein EAW52_24220 [Pseudomonas sp. LTJR-52]
MYSERAQLLELQLCDLEYIKDLDCDGFSACVQYLLNKAKLSHQLMRGHCRRISAGHIIVPHYWIELSPDVCAYLQHPNDQLVIDFNLRKWLFEDEEVPHGVFAKNRESDFRYIGESINTDFGLDFWELDSMTEGRLARMQINI